MTAETLAAAILRDVPLYEPDNPPDNAPSMKLAADGDWLKRAEVLAALSRALSDDLVERAGAILTRLGILSDTLSFQAHDLITALLARNAALTVERDDLQHRVELAEEAAGMLLDAAKTAEAEVARLRGALDRINQWAEAYPLKVFPEPDFDKVREALEAAGLSLDAVSASNMRHIIEGVGRIANAALKGAADDRT